jgi:hypothetical protein
MGSASTVHLFKAECGFASTDATYTVPSRTRLYWHKGKGVLSCIVFKEEKEVEFADIITGRPG